MRIDIHNHYMPADFVAEARQGKAIDNVRIAPKEGREWVQHPQGFHYPLFPEFWQLEAKLAHMDRYRIDLSVMSVSPTLLFSWTAAAPARLLRPHQ